ncbi:hypothetical protein EV216_10975 [Rhodovulum steppense]|uniref:Uncharacterized protein n=2 Tax=Rhodovulum steppense TaxID=540251 RepID=A0A4R1YV45_9RHOB|nr:hypothetical protein EV216_10975 [Rhodovulum steppense]
MVALPTAPAGRLALVQPPAPQPAAAPPPPMPAPDVFVRVFVTNAVSDDGIAKTVASLDGAGYDMAPPARVRVVIAETDVRFFHRQDAEAARVLAEHLDGVTRDFTGAARKPRPGQLELWLAGGARQPQPARTTQPEMRTVRPPTQAATSRRSQAPAQTTTAAELRNEVLRKLREVNSQ